ncbi:MAG: lysozyme [Rhodoferax sp.]|nr:lysozyme [Rhodoferax sp.]
MNDIDPVVLATALARHFEGLYLTPYLCPAGVPTVGYGATYYEDGTRVTLLDPPITRERADALLLWMVRTVYLPAVMQLCPLVTAPGRVAAIIDFVFNLGSGKLRASTLRRRVNAGAWDAVPAELRKCAGRAGQAPRGRNFVGLMKLSAAPSIPDSPARTSAITADNDVPVAAEQLTSNAICEKLAEDATQATLMLVELQRWYIRQQQPEYSR